MTSVWSVDRERQVLLRDGAPWFLLGDTAWELFRRLRIEQAEIYLTTRAEQGFNTVLAVGVSEFDARTIPNASGDLPFVDDDPARPNEPFWQHIDAVIRRANELGLVVGLLPTWGNHWHADPAFFDAALANAFGRWLALRYADAEIIWVLGGDRPITSVAHRATVDAMAAGIRAVVGNRQLLTFHPPGRWSSTEFLADTEWVDVDMIQSGHSGFANPNYQAIEQDLNRHNARPTLDAEPNYEDHPVMSPTWVPLGEWRFDDRDVRRAAYHAVFAGACGHVYGAHPVWQMYQPGSTEPINHPARSWTEALQLPGADQLRHLAALVQTVGIDSWVGDQSVIHHGHGVQGSHQRAMVHRTEPGLLAYLPGSRAVEFDLRRWPADTWWRVRWFDPRTGAWSDGADLDASTSGGRVRLDHLFADATAESRNDAVVLITAAESLNQTAGSR